MAKTTQKNTALYGRTEKQKAAPSAEGKITSDKSHSTHKAMKVQSPHKQQEVSQQVQHEAALVSSRQKPRLTGNTHNAIETEPLL